MPQPPYQVDQLQVEPSSGQTLTISRDAATGSLRFVDAVVTSGVNLSEMSGISTVDSVFVVGTAGAGATYSTVQAAIDAVPITSNENDPNVILVTPGVYQENLVLEKDGVSIIGLGEVVLKNNGASPTLTIQQGVATPELFLMRNMKIENDSVGQACINIQGVASTNLGANLLSFEDCTFVTSDIGNFPVLANVCNNIRLVGCSLSTGSSAILSVQQVADFKIKSCTSVPSIQLAYDNTGTQPSLTTSQFSMEDCDSVLATIVNLSGEGSFSAKGCPVFGDFTVTGDRSSTFNQCNLGNLSINGTSAVTLQGCTRGTAAGAGVLDEDLTQGTVAFSASSSETVTLPVGRTSNDFTILLDTGDATPSFVSNKTTTGFDVEFTAPVTTTVRWVLRG